MAAGQISEIVLNEATFGLTLIMFSSVTVNNTQKKALQ